MIDFSRLGSETPEERAARDAKREQDEKDADAQRRAQCVETTMAARLSEDPMVRVLLLEAGGKNTSVLVRMPAGVGTPSSRLVVVSVPPVRGSLEKGFSSPMVAQPESVARSASNAMMTRGRRMAILLPSHRNAEGGNQVTLASTPRADKSGSGATGGNI